MTGHVWPEPDVRNTPGGWLAVSGAGDLYRIGVMGDTEELARANFHESRTRWQELADTPDDTPVTEEEPEPRPATRRNGHKNRPDWLPHSDPHKEIARLVRERDEALGRSAAP